MKSIELLVGFTTCLVFLVNNTKVRSTIAKYFVITYFILKLRFRQLVLLYKREVLTFKRGINLIQIWYIDLCIAFNEWRLRRQARKIGIPIDVLQKILDMNSEEADYDAAVQKYLNDHTGYNPYGRDCESWQRDSI